jgi:hypothetical protein
MTSRAGLLPHERVCDGDGCENGFVRVAASDHPGEERSWKEPCPLCDGTMTITVDERQHHDFRALVDSMDAELREKILAVLRAQDHLHDVVIEQRDAADARVTRLQLENRQLRGLLTEKVRLYEQLHKRHDDALRLLVVSKPDHDVLPATEVQ